MRGMKVRYSVSGLLMLTAAIAIAFTGMQAWAIYMVAIPGSTAPQNIRWGRLSATCHALPLWVPFAFATYAVACKALTYKMILVFAVLEAIAFGIAYSFYLNNWF